MVEKSRIIAADAAGIAEGVARLLAGGIVAVPTETVYGLAACAADAEAVARIYEAKGRPSFNPLIVHVTGVAQARDLVLVDALAERLMAAFWPGPLTLVLPLLPGAAVAGLVTAGLDTLAVRCPAHPVMQALIAGAGPLAAPSANASGRISATTAAHVAGSLGDRVGLVLDGGACAAGGGIVAPGMLASHYAPRQPVRLEALTATPHEFHIGFGAISGDASLSPAGDLVEAAARLFDLLHVAQASGRSAIAVAPVPETGLGLAINDRLRRAAAPRL